MKNMLAFPPTAKEVTDIDDDGDTAANTTNNEPQSLVGVQPEEERKLQLKV